MQQVREAAHTGIHSGSWRPGWTTREKNGRAIWDLTWKSSECQTQKSELCKVSSVESVEEKAALNRRVWPQQRRLKEPLGELRRLCESGEVPSLRRGRSGDAGQEDVEGRRPRIMLVEGSFAPVTHAPSFQLNFSFIFGSNSVVQRYPGAFSRAPRFLYRPPGA